MSHRPGVLALHSSYRASMSWPQIPSVCWEPRSTSTPVFVSAPSSGKADTAETQGMWTLQAQASTRVALVPNVYPHLIVLMCSSFLPLASCWVFSRWNNWTNGASGPADFGLWASVSHDVWESLPGCVLGGQDAWSSFAPLLEKQAGRGATRNKIGLPEGTSNSLLTWDVRPRITQEWKRSFNFRNMGLSAFPDS